MAGGKPPGFFCPHLTMAGASHVFSRAEVPVWGFHEVGRRAQGASRVAPGKLGFNGRGEGTWLLRANAEHGPYLPPGAEKEKESSHQVSKSKTEWPQTPCSGLCQ